VKTVEDRQRFAAYRNKTVNELLMGINIDNVKRP